MLSLAATPTERQRSAGVWWRRSSGSAAAPFLVSTRGINTRYRHVVSTRGINNRSAARLASHSASDLDPAGRFAVSRGAVHAKQPAPERQFEDHAAQTPAREHAHHH